MTLAPKRRWFAFSLRTMFLLVTVACLFLGWLTWNLRQLRNRTEVARTIELHGGRVEWGWIHQSDLKLMPSLWRLLGAEPMFAIRLPAAKFTRQEAAGIREVFPEAVFVSRDDPNWDNLDQQ